MTDKIRMSEEQGRPSVRRNTVGKVPKIVNTGLFVVSTYAVVNNGVKEVVEHEGHSRVSDVGAQLRIWTSVCPGELLKASEQ